MEDDQTSLRSTDAKQWERPWSTDEIRANSANWTLAGDTGLLHYLQEYSHNLISRTHETEKLVNELVYKNKAISAKVNNVINDFQMLSNEQFIENRVYDEEIEDSKASPDVPEVQKTKEQREAEMIPRVTEALNLGLSVLDQAFHKVQVEETSDSEEDEYRVQEGRIVLEPKDPYEHRPLPFIIGSDEFHQDDFVGLRDLYVEDVVEKLTDEESVSVASLSSSSLDESDVEIEAPFPKDAAVVPNDYREEIVPPRNIDHLKRSESEGSDLFDMEKEDDDNLSSNLEAEERMLRENEQNRKLNASDLMKEVKSAIKDKIEADITKAPQSSKQEKYDDDLFGSVENDNLADENSPFQKKSGSLFSTGLAFTNGKDDVSDDDDDDDDLFGTKEKSHVISSKSETTVIPQAVAPRKETKAPDLFGDSEDENEDIFTSLPSKKSFTALQPSSATPKDEPSEAARTSKSISSMPDQMRKMSSNTFTEMDDKSSSDSLFGDDSISDDLFSTKSEKKLSIGHFMGDEEDDDLFSSLKLKSSDNSEPKKTDKGLKEKQPSQQSKKPEPNLFGTEDDDDDFDLFGSSNKTYNYTFPSPTKETENIPETEKTVSPNHIGRSTRVSSIKTEPFNDAPQITDFLSGSHSDIGDTTDSPKDARTSDSTPVKIPSDSKNIVSSKSNVSPLARRSAEVPNKKLLNVENQADLSVSFDEPLEHHNTLNAINKGRAKIPGKRRKPTRKARHASLTSESVSSEAEESTKKTTETDSSPVKGDLNFLGDSSDLFGSTVTDTASSDSQITPKKVVPFGINKNIMSQLVSEISTSKILKKDVVSKPSDSFEDDSDDFFSPIAVDQSSSKAFDFLPESTKQETPGETLYSSPTVKAGMAENKLLDSDSTLEEDLFSEPAFKGFRTSVSDKDSFFSLDDDDDIFKVTETNKQKSSIPSVESSDDIFAYPEEDIFAGVAKEKYEMIPNQLFDDDDDIFENLDATTEQATSGSNTKKTSKIEIPKKEPVDTFDDPLSAFTSD